MRRKDGIAWNRVLQEEEEEMDLDRPRDLEDGWEYKILRSATAAFRKPERLRQVLLEESQAGWELVEKFDDCRLRLKRPTERRAFDSSLSFNPYRTWVGGSDAFIAACVAAGIILAATVFVIVVAAARGH